MGPRRQTHHGGRILRPVVFTRPASSAYEQSVYVVHTEYPTHVLLTENGDVIGPGFGIQSYFVLSRLEFYRVGCEVSTHEGENLKPHRVHQIHIEQNVILLEMDEPILLGQGYSELGALSKHGYTKREIKWADDYVKGYIKRVYPPESRSWRGDED